MPPGPIPHAPRSRWERLVALLPRLAPGAVLVASLWSLVGDITGLARLLRPDTWRLLTHADSPRYHPLWGWVLASEMTATVILLLGCIALLALLLARHPRFPALMSGLLGCNLAWAAIDWLGARTVAGSLTPDAAQAVRQAASANLYIALALAAGLIPWLLRSTRVREAYAPPEPPERPA